MTSAWDKCPVCLLTVPLTSVQRLVWTHNDTIGNRCPMSNHELPQSVWRAA